MRHRQGIFRIKLESISAGTQVRWRLRRLEFAVGAYFLRSRFQSAQRGERDGVQYLDKFKCCFNAVTVPVFWHLTEPQQGVFDFEPYIEMCRWAEKNGKHTFGHALFYGWDGPDDCDPVDAHKDFIQPWVKKLDRLSLEQTIKAHLARSLERFGPYIRCFNLNNEVLGKNVGSEPNDWFSKRLGFTSLAPFFQWAHVMAPEARFYVNEHSILNGVNTAKYIELIDSLLQQGAPLGGIGLQGHFFGERVPLSDEMWERLEILGRFGLPIRVTEFGVRATDPQVHAGDILRLLEVCFAHPRVEGVHFWNFYEPDTWPRDGGPREAPLWRTNWSATPAGEALQHLMTRKWTSEGTAIVNSQGEIQINGYFGRYILESDPHTWTIDLTAENAGKSILLGRPNLTQIPKEY